MSARPKLLRITTIPLTLRALLNGQLSYMRRHGFEVVAVSSPGEFLDELERDGVRTKQVAMHRRVSPLADIRALGHLVALMRSERPHIVHTHTPKAGLLGMIAARIVGVPIRVHTYAGAPYDGTPGLGVRLVKVADRVTARLATHLWAVGSEIAEFLVHEGVVARDRVEVLGSGSSNGVDLDAFSFAPKSAPSTPAMFGWVGRLSSEKGIEELQALWKEIKRKKPDARLQIVGGLDERTPASARAIRALREMAGVVFCGFQLDIAARLHTADVLLFTSRREGLPGVVLQAQACGTPVIALRCRGIGDALVDGVGGRIFERHALSEAAQAAAAVLDDPAQWQRYRRGGRRFVEEHFDHRVFVERLRRRYLELLDGAARGGDNGRDQDGGRVEPRQLEQIGG